MRLDKDLLWPSCAMRKTYQVWRYTSGLTRSTQHSPTYHLFAEDDRRAALAHTLATLFPADLSSHLVYTWYTPLVRHVFIKIITAYGKPSTPFSTLARLLRGRKSARGHKTFWSQASRLRTLLGFASLHPLTPATPTGQGFSPRYVLKTQC